MFKRIFTISIEAFSVAVAIVINFRNVWKMARIILVRVLPRRLRKYLPG